MTWPMREESGDDNATLHKVPLNMLYRWFMYDMNVEVPNDHIDIFKITPVSEEGDEKERQDSEARADAIEPLLPFLNLYANMNAHYIFEMQKKDLINAPAAISERLDSDKATIKAFYSQVTLAGLITALSSAVELGILKSEGAFTGIN